MIGRDQRLVVLLGIATLLNGGCKDRSEQGSGLAAGRGLATVLPYLPGRVAVAADLPENLPVALADVGSKYWLMQPAANGSGTGSHARKFAYSPTSQGLFALRKTADPRLVTFRILKRSVRGLLSTANDCLVVDYTMGGSVVSGSCESPHVVFGIAYSQAAAGQERVWLLAAKAPFGGYRCLGSYPSDAQNFRELFARKSCQLAAASIFEPRGFLASYIVVEPGAGNFPGQDLGYPDGHPYAKGFRRGFYDADASGKNHNYCRVVGSPETYVACSQGASSRGAAAFHFSTQGLDQGYDGTRGMFLVRGHREMMFCRGVGMDGFAPDFACVAPVKQHGLVASWSRSQQYLLMGQLATMGAYRQAVLASKKPDLKYPAGPTTNALPLAKFFAEGTYPFRFGVAAQPVRVANPEGILIEESTRFVDNRQREWACPQFYSRGKYEGNEPMEWSCQYDCQRFDNRELIDYTRVFATPPPVAFMLNPRYFRLAFSDFDGCWLCPLGYSQVFLTKTCERIP